MENQVQIFDNPEFGKIRTVIINGEIWFVGRDVATALGYEKARNAIANHVDSEDALIWGIPTNGGVQQMTVINESGLYSLILSSKLPRAKEFKRWVTSEVLPAIRKTGSYSLPKNETQVAVQNPLPKYSKIIEDIGESAKNLEKYFGVKPGIALAKMISLFEENHELNLTRIKELLPAAEHEIGYLTPTQIGKEIGKSSQYVNKKLVELGFQEKDEHGGYILTEKGKEYGEAMPFERNGHSGYQIKWTFEVVQLLN
jgi:prophage antirepressor-like protein